MKGDCSEIVNDTRYELFIHNRYGSTELEEISDERLTLWLVLTTKTFRRDDLSNFRHVDKVDKMQNEAGLVLFHS